VLPLAAPEDAAGRVAAVPEPGTLALAACGLFMASIAARRRNSRG